MKRYLAFYGDIYYAEGGMNDFVIDCNTVEDCEKAIELKHKQYRPNDIEWAWAWRQIWDTEKREFVFNTYD